MSAKNDIIFENRAWEQPKNPRLHLSKSISKKFDRFI